MRTIVNDSTLGIVDNDPLVASAIQSLLVETCAPIQILWTVTSAEQALEAMRDSAQRPQAVLTDIAMPGMNGSELAHHIKEQHPDIAVIGISAFLDDENEKKIRSTMVRCVLCDYSKRNSHDSTGSNHRKSHWKRRGCVVGGEEHKLHAAFRQGITDHCQLCERIHHFHYCAPTEYQRSIGKDICTTSFREAPCS